MKYPLRPVLPIVAFCVAALGLCSTATADPSPVSLRVEQSNRSETPNPKEHWTKTHSRKLHIFASNQSNDPLELKVKYVIFGRDPLTHDIVKVVDGENPVSVKPHDTGTTDSTEAKTTTVDAHFDAKAKKMSEASGATIVGAGVQVSQGDKVVAEWYEPEAMKEQWTKAQPMIGSAELKPKATPAKK